MSGIQDKLSRVRKPRVHISYDVETEGATVQKELPFVVGVMGDYSGNNPYGDVKAFKDRRFIQTDRDNFNEVLSNMKPGLSFRVENKLTDDGSEMPVSLQFKSMDDFEPAAIVEQVDPLKKLLDTRNQLRDLLTKIDRSDDLENLLEKVLTNPDVVETLSNELGLSAEDFAKKAKKEGDE